MSRALIALVLVLALAPPPTLAPPPAVAQVPVLVQMQLQCLSRRERRAVIRSGAAVRPGRLVRRLGGNALRLDLCRSGSGLVWLVTVLRGDGRVVDYVLDAQSGGRLQ